MGDFQQVSEIPQEVARAKNTLATASLVLGIIAVPTGLIFIGQLLGILAIVLGIVALVRYGKDKQVGGQGKAIAGIILGVIGICMIVVTMLVALAIPRFAMASKKAKLAQGREVLREIYQAEQDFYIRHGCFTPPAEDIFGIGSIPEGLIVERPIERQRFMYDILEDGVVRARPDLTVDPKLEDIKPLMIDEKGQFLGGLDD